MMLAKGPKAWWQRQSEAYRHGEERPLGGYVMLMTVYATATVGGTAAAKALGRELPDRVSPWDLLQLTAATHKLSRLIAKDPVTSPFRAPFTRFEGTSAPSELAEEVRGHGLQHSVGELLTCPMCLAQWVATALTLGLVVAPRPTRMMISVFTAVAGADFLHHLYAALQQASE
jgi:Protein of unknown function (DUF1360)